MAEFVVPLRKEIKDNLTRQGMQNIRGLRGKGLAEREKRNQHIFLRAHIQAFTVKKNMHLILNISTGALVTVAISTTPDGGFHRESMCRQTKPAHIPHDMLRLVKVQIVRWHQGGHPHSGGQAVPIQGDRQTKNDKSPVCCRFPKGSCQQCPSTLSSS